MTVSPSYFLPSLPEGPEGLAALLSRFIRGNQVTLHPGIAAGFFNLVSSSRDRVSATESDGRRAGHDAR